MGLVGVNRRKAEPAASCHAWTRPSPCLARTACLAPGQRPSVFPAWALTFWSLSAPWPSCRPPKVGATLCQLAAHVPCIPAAGGWLRASAPGPGISPSWETIMRPALGSPEVASMCLPSKKEVVCRSHSHWPVSGPDSRVWTDPTAF